MGVIRRICAAIALTVCVFTASVYFTFFHHPPADVVLSNQPGQPQLSVDKFVLDPSRPHTMAEISEAAWGKFLYDNKYVSIGDIYDSSCDDTEKILIGKVILLPDKKTDSLKTRIYLNTTIEKTVVYGTIAVIVHYNGKELYNNRLDMCTAEEGDEVQVLKCPLMKGLHFLVKEVKVPPLLPTGDYTLDAWVTDEEKQVILCSKLSFKL